MSDLSDIPCPSCTVPGGLKFEMKDHYLAHRDSFTFPATHTVRVFPAVYVPVPMLVCTFCGFEEEGKRDG
jgi:hypothetical protein